MTVVGLGVEGIDLVRYLAAEGARVTVSDARPAEPLRDALDAIADCEVELALGGHRPADFTEAACVFVSQACPRSCPRCGSHASAACRFPQ